MAAPFPLLLPEGRPDIRSGLVAFWPLNEASGDAADAFSANTLTDNNTVTSESGWWGSARRYTSANSEYHSIADNAALSGSDRDMCWHCWVKFTTVPATHQGILSKYGGAGGREWNIRRSSNNRFSMEASGDGTATTLLNYSSALVTAAEAWYCVFAWHDSVNNLLGMQVNDGAVSTTAHSTGIFNSTAAFNIGRFGGAFYLDGVVKNVAIWNRIPPPEERRYIYQRGPGAAFPLA